MTLRRDFTLPPADVEFLDAFGRPWETVTHGNGWVLIHDVPAPRPGYAIESYTMAIRIEPGYPMACLDMVYVYPALVRADGQPINATQVTQDIEGRSYQRWSRHYTAENPWIPGTDGLERHVLSAEQWFAREVATCT
ncbi:E2/UBC family protein [Aerolutibacter ruishenii]|uniref:E2/UBC family protein E n=1 Tax=Aerolutibacter ruishenii TaxID=686800 RepID=A0A562LFI1_9GAMM|nr:E2/UBC family protein [Lysobacter ruishenii]TWI06374.1 E2/UBC family protein E [Lysobacter ruishenii]